MIGEIGNDAYNQIQTQNIGDFISGNRPDGSLGKFYDVVSRFKEMDPDVYNSVIKGNDPSVDHFITAIYSRDELIKQAKILEEQVSVAQ